MPLYYPPDRLIAQATTLVLSDDGTNQTLTGTGTLTHTGNSAFSFVGNVYGSTNNTYQSGLQNNAWSAIYGNILSAGDDGVNGQSLIFKTSNSSLVSTTRLTILHSVIGTATATWANISGMGMGSATISGTSTITPAADNSVDVGSTAARYRAVHAVTFASAASTLSIQTYNGSSTNTSRLFMTGGLTTSVITMQQSTFTMTGVADTTPLQITHSVTGSGSASMLYLNPTWNTSGNPSCLLIDPQNTASGSTTNFIKCLLDSTTDRFAVRKTAELVQASAADSAGITSTGYSLSGSGTTGYASFSGTLNTSGSPTIWLRNYTNTASGASTLLFDWQVGSATRFSLAVGGAATITLAGSYSATVNVLNLVRGITLTGATTKVFNDITSGSTVTITGATNTTLRAFQVSGGPTGGSSNTNHYEGFNFPINIGGTTFGHVYIFNANPATTATLTEFVGYRCAPTQITGATPRVTGFETTFGDNASDMNWSTYGAAFASKAGSWSAGNGASVMPDWYGILIENQAFSTAGDNFATVPRKHGFGIDMDSNFTANSYLYWGSLTTDVSARSFGQRWNSTTAQFEMYDSSSYGVSMDGGGINNIVTIDGDVVTFDDNVLFS